MAISNRWVRSRKVIASTTAILVAIGVPTTFAILHQGFPVTDVDLSTRDVWVTNGERSQAGRLNRQIEELNGAVSMATNTADVVQNGTDVFLVDNAAGSVERIDPAFTRLIERIDIPPAAQVGLGGTSLAILAPTGQLWIVDVANQLDFSSTDIPVAELGKDARVAVSPTGTVFAASPNDQKLISIEGVGAIPVEHDVDFSSNFQLTAVGNRGVILDLDSNSIVTDGGTKVDLGGETGMKIQQPGKENSDVVIATGNTLLRVPLDGGTVQSAATTNATPLTDPTAVSSPVWLDGCAHGAWSGSQQYLLSCDDQQPITEAIPQPTIGSVVEFRVNKSVIALNNLNNGNVWLIDNEMRLVENWEEVTPPLEEETEEGDEKSSTQNFEDTLAERTDINKPPIANDDTMGLREGRTTILPVLENDSDADGDVLTITKLTDIAKEVGVLDLIDGGRALQFTPMPGISNASFDYTVDDGRKGVATAHVSLQVVPSDVNNPPEEKRKTTVSVESRGQIEYNVLTDWIDPDGDDLTLVSASPVSGDQVRFTPDGFITFQSKTAELGEKEVRLQVTDGDEVMTGTFFVDVKGAKTLDPIGVPDYAEVFVNETVVVHPLDNDIAPAGGKLALISLDEVPEDASVIPNLEGETVTFSASDAGTYYFLYALGSGSRTSIGIVRVDVRENPDEPLPPVAVKDSAYLRANEPTIIKVLANDVSPNNLVLAVQGTDTESTAEGLSVEVLNNTNIRITSSAALTEQTQFTYTISDGLKTALAGVTVVPVAPIVNRQPPVAVDDVVSVRAGDIVSYDVLKNDSHPDASQLFLEPELADDSRIGEGGLAFVNGQRVRYQAPKKEGDYSATYRISDKYGESATAIIRFIVKKENPETNQPPQPEPQTARVFAGESVKITIPLDGIDPDGDSVMLTRIVQSPAKGVPSELTEKSFIYTANPSSQGTDTLRYEVEDTFGKKAEGTISIGVIPQGETTDPPKAIDDSIEIKPGRTASVQVLLNDSDPNGYKLAVSDELLDVEKGIEARVERDKVIVEAPETEGTWSIRYQIDNGHSGIDNAFLQVRVTKDAKPLYPAAQDYYVPFDDIVDDPSVTVDLEPLIANPSGLARDLVITVEGANADLASVDQENQTITVRPGDRRTAIAYTVTNTVDELSGSAFIVVPPKVNPNETRPPYLRTDLGEQIVEMNGKKSWKLADILTVPSGRKPIITEASKVKATYSDGKSGYVDDETIGFTAAKEYRGPASITFEVTDGSGPEDPNGNVATIVMGFTVGDPDFKDTPPSFTTQEVRLEAGPDGKVTVDLRASSSHPNPALVSQFTYDGLDGATGDIEANLSGSDLTISSPLGTPVGSKAQLRFTVKYGEFEVPGLVKVTRVPSTKPLPQAVEDTDKGRRGVQQPAYDVLANDYNPFANSGGKLTVLDATIENSAQTSATVSLAADGKITVNPDTTFIGVVSVVYTIEDATKEPTRHVQGRYLLTVRDVPSKVDAPTATPGDLQATASWATPATNGEPITGYTVSWTPADGAGGGSVELPASAASHTVTGLTNGTDYRFRVVAHNILGPSTISDQSNAARPKGQATPPTSVSLATSTTGNGVLSMSWGGAGANGGEITAYAWTVWAGGAVAATGKTTGATSAQWAGTVGTAYEFSVIAEATGGNSNPSPRSNAVKPPPGAPSASLSASGTPGEYNLAGSYGQAAANGVSNANVDYSWSISGGRGSGSQKGPYNLSSPQGQGNPNTTYTLTVTVSVNGASASTTRQATTPGPYIPPAPSYTLCYSPGAPSGFYYHGVRFANVSGSHQFQISGYNSKRSSDGSASGTVVLGSYHARNTSGDLNGVETLLIDGGAYSSTRWGDAPPC